ncbi:MAG: hypothetical protein ABII80_02575 [bacterium]
METEPNENQPVQIEPNYKLDNAEILVGITLLAGASELDCHQLSLLVMAAIYLYDGLTPNSIIKRLARLPTKPSA